MNSNIAQKRKSDKNLSRGIRPGFLKRKLICLVVLASALSGCATSAERAREEELSRLRKELNGKLIREAELIYWGSETRKELERAKLENDSLTDWIAERIIKEGEMEKERGWICEPDADIEELKKGGRK